MCGITGFWMHPSRADATAELIESMAGALVHRGPDDSGLWCDVPTGLALGHRRLSIIDLSPTGHQPMSSANGRYIISFNGEIYNFRELRQELEQSGCRLRGTSDTEVILEAAVAWGVAPTITRMGGMFAFALWDREKRQLYLVRDRIGKKPLYVYRGEGCLLFGSELKALCAYPGFPRRINPQALALYLRYTYVPSPYAIYQDTYKVLPGQYMVIAEAERGGPGSVSFHTYWDALKIAGSGVSQPLEASEPEIIEQAQALIGDAVSKRMISDVPLGALLSGGIDSSVVAALMQQSSTRPVKTFTIGFHEQEFNEAEYARAVAHHLGTDHAELFVTPQETLGVIPRLADIYDEPFADSSQIPTWAVSRLARSQVTVALSGDGGDELFGGYNRYSLARRSWDSVGWMPGGVRHWIARGMQSVPQAGWDRVYKNVSPFLPAFLRARLPGDKMHKLAAILDSPNGDLLYRQLVYCWPEPEQLCDPRWGMATNECDPLIGLQDRMHLSDFSQQMMMWDQRTYLPEDILVKVDRASMAVSLEMRAPLLDHRLIEFAWRLPLRFKIRGNTTKWLLRQVLYRYVPREMVERPKTGFGVPLGEWLCGPLKNWAEDLLDPARLEQDALFRPEVVRRYWEEHTTGTRDWKYRLWAILMFQAWKEKWRAQA